MRNKITIEFFIILALIVVACTPQAAEPTPTLAPTQTPFVLVVTATESNSPVPIVPTRTLLPTVTAISQTALPPPTDSILDRCSLRTDWHIYSVEVGDTLSNIAVRTDSTVTALQLANCISDTNLIQVGLELYVPELPDDEVLVEDLISDFSISVSEAHAGDTVTFSWEAEEGTVIEIKHVTGDNAIIASNLDATGSLTYTLPSELGDFTGLEFAINGVKAADDGDILATPYSVFINILADEPETTDEPEMTTEPESTDEPEVTEEPEMTTEPEVTEEAGS